VVIASAAYFAYHPAQWRTFYKLNFLSKGGLNAGNYGFVYLMSLLANDGHASSVLANWERFVSVTRFVLLGSTALLVFHSRRATVIAGVSALLLAHFLTYQHVWEHHMSAVCVLAAMLMTVPDRGRRRTAATLSCLLLLAVPSPFALLDAAKDPIVFDPALHWPRYASYVNVLSKVVPTVALYVIAMLDISRGGFMSPRAAIRSAWSPTTSLLPRAGETSSLPSHPLR